ncbi:flagellar motor protein MotB [Azorhizobium oxalatiphilum]|uniref:Flagellar motor protein MotB n=1 Tax=Azorhizobium oxalatiphilum TaxID=980631 RepID=A0A917BL40_9HYPH|nr:MotB family protein [Azorhizobium oxalatiphilum]GGF47650.1 flagellar motor protein MotB [Azorhizobium oxalatiphilum]
MSDKADHPELIIIKRHEEEEHEHHSSAWKVAHADFMTAMMAFFLIMWLINVTDKDVRKAIASYFNPVHLAESMTERKGLNDPEEIKPEGTSADGKEHSALKQTAGVGTGPGSDTQNGDRDRSAFQDPYAVLSKLAGEADPADMSTPDAAVGETGKPGNTAGDATRDPFDPVYWQMNQAQKLRSERQGPQSLNAPTANRPDARVSARGGGEFANEGSDAIPVAPVPDAVAFAGGAPNPATQKPDPTKQNPGMGDVQQGTQAQGEAPKGAQARGDTARGDQAKGEAAKGDQSKGTAQAGVTQPGTAQSGALQPGSAAAKADAARLQGEVLAAVQSTIGTGAAPHVEVRATAEGLVISLTDDQNYSMFPVGSAVPDGRLVRAMERISTAVAKRPGEVVVQGYTDGRPYRSDTYDNWRLSTARAHMAYYMLVRGGLPEQRVTKIEGFADRKLKNSSEPYAAENRRIEIVLRVPN